MNERQSKLLREIVESYIKTAKPIGSKSLCKKLGCSSATIRNEMAHLEELGYIEKNHISSGRIPSEMGYKYYVANLMKPKELSEKDARALQTIFRNQELALSDAIEAVIEIISEMTNYTSVVLGKNSKENSLQQVNIIPLQNNKLVAVVVTNQGVVQNKQFTLPINISIQEVVKTSEIINKMLIGTPIEEVSQRLEFEIKPIIAEKIEAYETIYTIFSKTFNDFASKASESVHMSKKNYLLEEPEYNDVDEIRKIMTKFEDQNLIDKIDSTENKDAVNIYIGNENEFDENVTVIKTTYKKNGSEGTIAIIGPKRMEYDRVVGLLSFINKELNEEE
ncbi:MAG: heat-inducible transcription repressor HrcA [Bacilli bacterium]|nr:heat-inducible transcription repressor HrcA [Bacilli bacterium]MBR1748314.1 heat-inducible transcription repressor HrcA [Bacilli bacterium]MBR1817554.1 heat-inducible transcription repressor HrcA [Bacilli bacterium]